MTDPQDPKSTRPWTGPRSTDPDQASGGQAWDPSENRPYASPSGQGHGPPGHSSGAHTSYDQPAQPGQPSYVPPQHSVPPGRPADRYQPPSYSQPGRYGPQPSQYGQSAFGQPPSSLPPGYAAQPVGPYGLPPHLQPSWAQAVTAGRSRRSFARVGGVVGAVLAIVVAAVLVLGFWKPGFFNTTDLDVTAAQTGVAQVLSDKNEGYGANNVTDVRCNNGQNPTIEPGSTFDCEVSIDGAKRQVTVTIVDDKGTYDVGPPR